jgi:hypothetical protein
LAAGAGAWLLGREVGPHAAATVAAATTAPAATVATSAVGTVAAPAVSGVASPAVGTVASPAGAQTRNNETAEPGETATVEKLGEDKRDGRVGYLTVAVLPFAEVVVDGRVAGTTPLRRLPLKAGVHTIVLRNGGLHKNVRRNERIEPGAHHRLQLDWSN